MFWFKIFSVLGFINAFNCDSKILHTRHKRDYPLSNYGPPTQPPKWSIPYDSSCLCPSSQYGSHPPSYGSYYQPPIYSQPSGSYHPSPVYRPPSGDNQSSYLPSNDGLPPPLIPPTLYATADDNDSTTIPPPLETTPEDLNQSSSVAPSGYPSSSYYPSYQPPSYHPPNYQSPTYQAPGYQNPARYWNQFWLKTMYNNPQVNYQPLPGSKFPARFHNIWPFPSTHKKPENNQQQVIYIQQPHILPILSLPPAPFDFTSRSPSKIQETTKYDEQTSSPSNQTAEQTQAESVSTTDSALDVERIEQESADESIVDQVENEREEKKYSVVVEHDSNVHNNTV